MTTVIGRQFNKKDERALLRMPLEQMRIGHFYRLHAYLHYHRLSEKLIRIELEAKQTSFRQNPMQCFDIFQALHVCIQKAAKVCKKISAFHAKYLTPEWGLPSDVKWILSLPLNKLMDRTEMKAEIARDSHEEDAVTMLLLARQFSFLLTQDQILDDGLSARTMLGAYKRYIRDIIEFEAGDGCPFGPPPPPCLIVYEQAALFFAPIHPDSLDPSDCDCTLCAKPLHAAGSHAVCRLPCGHVFGLGCVEDLLRETFK